LPYARQVAQNDLRRAHLAVRVGGEDVAITWATRNEILKFLQRAAGTLNVVLYFENVGARRPVDPATSWRGLGPHCAGGWVVACRLPA
jgi:hypothetical protein